MVIETKKLARPTIVQGSGIQVIARAAAILRALEDEPTGLSLGQIAERVKLARSTVQRIVGALAAEHLLIAATPGAGVRLGPALVRLASSTNVELDQLLRPALVKLSRTLKEEQWTRLLGKNLRSYTQHTRTELGVLQREVEDCRRSQIAYDREEHTEGIAAVGTAFLLKA
jgi:DNA-binding IclR family transcriptional regulator